MNAPANGGAASAVPEKAITVPDGDYEAYMEACRLQEQKSLGARFAQKALSANMVIGIALLMSVGLNGYQHWQLTHTENKYFSTQDGRITRIYPLNRPAWSLEDVTRFGADTIQQSFTMDFVHYRNQMTNVISRFNEQGYADYYKSLTNSNVLKMVRDRRMNLSTAVSPGVVHSQGLLNGIYAWKIQYPVTLQLDGQESSLPPQRYIVELLIQQADPRTKPLGLEVRQTIMTARN